MLNCISLGQSLKHNVVQNLGLPPLSQTLLLGRTQTCKFKPHAEHNLNTMPEKGNLLIRPCALYRNSVPFYGFS